VLESSGPFYDRKTIASKPTSARTVRYALNRLKEENNDAGALLFPGCTPEPVWAEWYCPGGVGPYKSLLFYLPV